MNQYQDTDIISNPSLRDRAKGALAGRFGQAVLAFFVVSVITIGAQLIASFLLSFLSTIILITKELLTSTRPMTEVLGALLDPSYMNRYSLWLNLLDHILGVGVSFFTAVFNVGFSLFCLKLACGQAVGVADVFYGFQHQFRKSLKLSVIYTLVQEIFLFPVTAYLYLRRQNAIPTAQLAFLALTVIGVAIAAYLLLRVSQCFFLLLDFPDLSAKELLRLSAHIMEGHKKRLLLLHLSFVPLFLLSVFTFGIANLWIIPYRGVACAFFFLNLMQARDHNN